MRWAWLLLLVAALSARTLAEDRKCRNWCSKYPCWQFHSYYSGVIVYVDYCNITNATLGNFSNLSAVGVEVLMLYGNNIEHIELANFNFPKLISLYLNRIKLLEVPIFSEFLFPRISEINLSYNKITTISNPRTFAALGHLGVLILSSNLIEYVHPDVLKPLNSLKKLYLDNNRLRILSEKLFMPTSLELVDLHSNLLEYVPPGVFRSSRLGAMSLQNNSVRHLPVDFISEIITGPGLFFFKFDKNPWNCACLLELLAEIKKSVLIIIYDGYFDGTRPVCAYTGRVPCCRQAPSALLPPPRAPRTPRG